MERETSIGSKARQPRRICRERIDGGDVQHWTLRPRIGQPTAVGEFFARLITARSKEIG